MTTRSRFFSSSSGSAEMPSSSGISTSSTTTSGLTRSIWATASRPVRSEAATARSGSSSIQRETRPRTTTASSTIMTRIGGWPAGATRETAGATVAATLMNAVLVTRRATQGGNDPGRSPSGHNHRQISPTSWNLASTISLSNGFMMYSLAPACSARAICTTSFSVVQNTTLGPSPPGSRRSALRNS
jgi:hypothetical protein